MDCESLIESLRRGGDEKIRSFEAAMAEELNRIEQDISLKREALKEQYRKTLCSDTAKRTEEILYDAHRKADLARTAAFMKLTDRLYQLARASLPHLRNERYEYVFTALQAELPSLPWKSVKVNPADAPLAERSFSGSEVITDETISGGMDVMTGDGKVRVINTFEKRLERAWEDICPGLLQEDYESL